MLIGIDLGTTNSLVSVFTDDGHVLIPNALGHMLTPSAVSFVKGGNILVGQAAKDRLVTDPKNSHARFKRYMGTNKTFTLGRKDYRAEDLSALILRSLVADAERFLGKPVTGAVVSVPAYFNDVQRKATYAAGKIAGLKIERLINEPTAASLAYGLSSHEDENTFLVVDLGGGTFDVSILEIFDGVMEVRSSAGNAFLGGEDFTDLIVTHFKNQIDKSGAGKGAGKLTSNQESLLRELADKAKVEISQKPSISVKFNVDKTPLTLTLDREAFEDFTKPLQDKMREPIQRAMNDAGLRTTNIDRVVLVGGATRMPFVRALITRLLKVFPEHGLDPDEVVARGAAVQAGLVSRHAALEDVVMTDVCPFTLGIEVAVQHSATDIQGGHFQPIIERNTVIPVSRVSHHATIHPGQKEVNLKVFQGESPRVNENVFLGAMNVPVPYNNKELEAFDVRFTYDVSGVLEVITTVLSNKRTSRMIIEGNPGSMTSGEIDKRFKALDALKIHPADKAENAALIARLKRTYENRLGDMRQAVSFHLNEFERVLAGQKDTEIAHMRDEITQWLDSVDRDDVF